MRWTAAGAVVVVAVVVIAVVVAVTASDDGNNNKAVIWKWRCESDSCVRYPAADAPDGSGYSTCKLTCGELRSMWPRPTGPATFGDTIATFVVDNIKFQYSAPDPVKPLLETAAQIFQQQLRQLQPVMKKEGTKSAAESAANDLSVQIRIVVDGDKTSLSLDTNEFYQLSVNQSSSDKVSVLIYSPTFFGARHGLETLSQMINFDSDTSTLQMLTSLMVSDAPVYPVRALTLDTARSYISLAGIKRTIDGMASNKLNTLHWHVTDTQSFPIEIAREPRLQQYGAYTPEKVYSADDVRQLVQYATVRGVRLLPELDAPAHVGYGWQWGQQAGLGNLALCVGQEPWTQYCVEPPCGQMNIVNGNMYNVLKDIYADFHDMFQPDIFHMGGDEINLNCWKSAHEITDYIKANGGDPSDDHEYMKLWVQYQLRAANIWGNISTERKTPLVIWTSDLTADANLRTALSPEQYIVQVWTTGTDQQIGDLLADGYRLILSNYDAWYLDCGFSAWIGAGHNWCAPYKSWQTVYDNSPRAIAEAFQAGTQANYTGLIAGGSAALWAEQSDDQTLDSRLWPRAAALAERLWSEPSEGSAAALTRLVHHRERLVQRGLSPDVVQPEYCLQNEGKCL